MLAAANPNRPTHASPAHAAAPAGTLGLGGGGGGGSHGTPAGAGGRGRRLASPWCRVIRVRAPRLEHTPPRPHLRLGGPSSGARRGIAGGARRATAAKAAQCLSRGGGEGRGVYAVSCRHCVEGHRAPGYSGRRLQHAAARASERPAGVQRVLPPASRGAVYQAASVACSSSVCAAGDGASSTAPAGESDLSSSCGDDYLRSLMPRPPPAGSA